MDPQAPHTNYIRYIPGKRSMLLISRLHTWLYGLSDGRLGSRIDGLDILLLETIGCRTGVRRRTPMPYFKQAAGYLLVASNSSLAVNPSWFFNLQAKPDCLIQIGREKLQVKAHLVSDAQRSSLWLELVRLHPRYAVYQEKTARQIPLMLLSHV